MARRAPEPSVAAVTPGRVGEVFLAFLALGLTSFGGPIAHLGYFRDAFVVRRRWIDEAGYADLIALCQFLPGPASSQVGFALGLMRGGVLGGLAAWTAFTLPSALLMVGVAWGAAALAGPAGLALVHGLKLVAVAVVAHAVLGMARSLTPDLARRLIALGALAVVVGVGGVFAQLGVIAVGGGLGLALCRSAMATQMPSAESRGSRRSGIACLLVFALLLLLLPVAAQSIGNPAVAVFDSFYRSGALVFGGGHVVLPLLQAELVPNGRIGSGAFLTGYGAAQAMPGPLFSFAAYLGWSMAVPPNGLAGSGLALVAVFLPGLLLVAGVLPFWERTRCAPGVQAAMRGANAAVVGILAAALYDPVWIGAVRNLGDVVIALFGFVALIRGVRPLIVVIGVSGTATLASIMA
jgi:chromate transporter